MFDDRHRRLLWLLAVACFTEGYDFNALIVALPQLRDTFDLTQAGAAAWVAAIYLGSVPAIVLGRQADRHGRRRMLLIAIAGYTVASVVTAVAPSIEVFVVMQFVARTFLTVQVAVAWTIAADDLPAERRGFGFGILALATALGTGWGALLEALLLSPLDASWRWLYAASLPLVLVIATLYRSLPESARYARLEAEGRPRGELSVLFSRAHRSRLLVICAASVLANLTTQATVFAVDYMQTQRHQSASAANLILVAAGAVMLPVLTGAGRLSDRIGRRPVCSAAMVVQAVGVVLFFGAATNGLLLIATLALTYLGVFGAWTTGSAFAVEAFPTALRASAGAAVTMAKLAGQCASFVISALVLRSTDSPLTAVALLAIGPLIAAVLVATLFPETSRTELADDEVAPPVAAVI